MDSQADVCIIKQSAIENNIYINYSDIIEIKGVTDNKIESIGTVQLRLNLGSLIVIHTFHVMPDSINIPSDGIIGKDFTKLHSCVIDYGDLTFTIRTQLGEITLPMSHESGSGEMNIPPRSEVKRVFKIESTSFPALIKSNELLPGVFYANTVSFESEREVRLINTTDSIQKTKINTLKAEPLKNYNIFTLNKESIDESRTEKVINLLKPNFPSVVR